MKSPSRSFARPLVLAAVLLSPLAVEAQSCWSAAGASAAVDGPDVPFLRRLGPTLALDFSAPVPFQLDANLSVTGITRLPPDLRSQLVVTFRFRDTGPQDRIHIDLRRVPVFAASGGESLVFFDSDRLPASPGFQRASFVGSCQSGNGIDTNSFFYFLNLAMSKLGPAGNPGLLAFQVCSILC